MNDKQSVQWFILRRSFELALFKALYDTFASAHGAMAIIAKFFSLPLPYEVGLFLCAIVAITSVVEFATQILRWSAIAIIHSLMFIKTQWLIAEQKAKDGTPGIAVQTVANQNGSTGQANPTTVAERAQRLARASSISIQDQG